MAILNTPLFVKTHDFVLWLIRHTQRFPKNLRHTLSHKLEWTAIELQQTLVMANSVRGAPRFQYLDQADGQLVSSMAQKSNGISAQGASSSSSQGRRPWNAVHKRALGAAQRANRSKSASNCRPVGPQNMMILFSQGQRALAGRIAGPLGRKNLTFSDQSKCVS